MGTRKMVELTGKSLSRGAAANLSRRCRWLCGGGGDGYGESECLELADVAACLAVGVDGVEVAVVAEVFESCGAVGQQVPDDDEQGAGDGDQGLELAAAPGQPPVSLAGAGGGLRGGRGRVAQDALEVGVALGGLAGPLAGAGLDGAGA